MHDNALSLLGIAKKAGLLAIGSEAAAISARQGKARLIFSAADASDGSIRRAKSNAADFGIDYLAAPYTKFEIGNITGRGSPGVVAILDKGLAMKFKEKTAAAQGSRIAAQMAEPAYEGKPEGKPPRAGTAKESDAL